MKRARTIKIKKKVNDSSFILYSVSFCFLVALLIFSLNTIYVDYVLDQKQTVRNEKLYADFFSNTSLTSLSYLFIGDSHTRNAMHPDYVPSSFNLASNGENYIQTYYKLKRVYDANITVESVVFELDYHMLAHTKGDNCYVSDLFVYGKIIEYEDLQSLCDKSFLSLWLESHLPFFGKGREFSLLVNNPKWTEIYKGWGKLEQDFSKEDVQKASSIKYFQHYEGKDLVDPLILSYFQRTLKLANEHGSDIIFVRYPVSKVYDDQMVGHNVSKQDFDRKVYSVIEDTLNGNYVIFDYYSYFFNVSYYFADPDHLNEKGAVVLSTLFYDDATSSEVPSLESFPILFEEEKE